MNEQMQLISPAEIDAATAAENGDPYRSGTSFGYCHVPVEIANLDNYERNLLLTFLILETTNRPVDLEDPDWLEKVFFIAPEPFSLKANQDAFESLKKFGVVAEEKDGSLRVNEPKLWDLGGIKAKNDAWKLQMDDAE